MLGTVLDPFADKLLVNVLAMSLSYATLLPGIGIYDIMEISYIFCSSSSDCFVSN